MERKAFNRTSQQPVVFPKLYHVAKTDKISEWSLSVQLIERIPTIVTEFGYVDGQKQTALMKVPYGKNIGRSNQTTPWEQAVADAKSKWEKKKLENYRESLEEETKLLPMLAHKYADHAKKVVWPCYIQPKINGVRCIATITDHGVEYYSRKGKAYETLNHWNETLQTLFPSGTILDGEAFNPYLNFQEIVRRVKRVKASRMDIESTPLEYWIYDIINDQPFNERTEIIHQALPKGCVDDVVRCPTRKIENADQLKSNHQDYVQHGFEGSIIRNSAGLYRPDYRSYDLLKHKDFIDKEFEIVGGRSATGRDEGTVVFECALSNGKAFSVRPKGTWEQRKEYLDNLDRYIGQALTVRYQETSEDGIPIFPVGLEIRDYE